MHPGASKTRKRHEPVNILCYHIQFSINDDQLDRCPLGKTHSTVISNSMCGSWAQSLEVALMKDLCNSTVGLTNA